MVEKLKVRLYNSLYIIIGLLIGLFYFLAYFYNDIVILSHYSILLLYLALSVFIIRSARHTSFFWMLFIGYIFRIIVIYFSFPSFVDKTVFSDIIDFFAYFSLKSFRYFPFHSFYLYPIVSFILDSFILLFLYFVFKFYKKPLYYVLLFWWNPFWIASIYVNWNPFLIYVFFLFLSLFLLLYKQRFVGAFSLSFVFGFYDFFYLFLPLSIYELKGAFLILVIAGFSFLNIYLEFIVQRFIYSDLLRDFISYIGSDLLLSFDTVLIVFVLSFMAISWLWFIFLKRSFFDKIYIALFALILIYPPFFLKGLAFLVIIFGAVFSNWGFLLLSAYFFILPYLQDTIFSSYDIYFQYLIIWLSSINLFIRFYRKGYRSWDKVLFSEE